MWSSTIYQTQSIILCVPSLVIRYGAIRSHGGNIVVFCNIDERSSKQATLNHMQCWMKLTLYWSNKIVLGNSHLQLFITFSVHLIQEMLHLQCSGGFHAGPGPYLSKIAHEKRVSCNQAGIQPCALKPTPSTRPFYTGTDPWCNMWHMQTKCWNGNLRSIQWQEISQICKEGPRQQ